MLDVLKSSPSFVYKILSMFMFIWGLDPLKKIPPNRLCYLIHCHFDQYSFSLHADCAGVYSHGDFMVHFAGLDDKQGWTSRILKEIGTP
jgi:hypothetical protein